MMGKAKGIREKVKGRCRRFGTVTLLIPFAFGLVPFPFTPFPFAAKSFAQSPQSELPRPLSARTISPRFHTLTMEDGLAQVSIAEIHQDARGFIWIGSQGGLNRWDGYEMRTYKTQPFDSTSISDLTVLAVDDDKDGVLWVGTGNGLNAMDPVTGRFKRWMHDPSDSTGLPASAVIDLLVADDQSIWLATITSGVVRMDRSDPPTFNVWKHDEHDSRSLSSNLILGLQQDHQGNIWAASQHGLNRIDPATGAITRYLELDPIPGCGRRWGNPVDGFSTYEVLERSEEPGILWVATEGGLARLDADSGAFEMYTDGPGQCHQVAALVSDPADPGVLWVSFRSRGVSRFDIRTRTHVVHDVKPGASMGAMAVDRSGIIWVGTWPEGISYFDPKSVNVQHLVYDPDNSSLLFGGQVSSVAQGADGVLWVWNVSAHRGGALTALDRERGKAVHYVHDPDNLNTPSRNGFFTAVTVDPLGFVWLGGAQAPQRLDPQSGRFTTYQPDHPAFRESPSLGQVMPFVDRAGFIWVGHDGLLAKTSVTDPGQFQYYVGDAEDETKIPDLPIRTISEGVDGTMWIGHWGALSNLDVTTGNARRWMHDPKDPSTLGGGRPSMVHERPREPGVIWITFYDAGLDRLDTRTGEFKHYTEKDGLADNHLYGVIEDDEGRLWMSSNRGISRFDPETETFRNYGLEIGLQHLEFNPAIHKGPRGEFFFGGQNGLNAFFPSQISENYRVPELTFVVLKIDNESVLESGAVSLGQTLDATDSIELRYDQRDIQIDYVGIHYTKPEANEYAYMLEGFNDDWLYVGERRSASFTNLEPGSYTFRVKAANSDGVWNEEGIALALSVAPPWWRTWWAYLIYGMLALAAVVVVDRVQRKRVLAEERERLTSERA